jgi:hypothetical protein
MVISWEEEITNLDSQVKYIKSWGERMPFPRKLASLISSHDQVSSHRIKSKLKW